MRPNHPPPPKKIIVIFTVQFEANKKPKNKCYLDKTKAVLVLKQVPIPGNDGLVFNYVALVALDQFWEASVRPESIVQALPIADTFRFSSSLPSIS